jgi:hypothetical protein
VNPDEIRAEYARIEAEEEAAERETQTCLSLASNAEIAGVVFTLAGGTLCGRVL